MVMDPYLNFKLKSALYLNIFSDTILQDFQIKNTQLTQVLNASLHSTHTHLITEVLSLPCYKCNIYNEITLYY